MRNYEKWGVFGLLAVLGLVGCLAGSGVGLDEEGNPIGGGEEESPCGSSGYTSTLDCDAVTLPFEAAFSNIESQILQGGIENFCTNCHTGGSPPQGLSLDVGNAYTNLVSVQSSELSSVCRVKPNSPDDSYLIMKLEGAEGISGARMPLGGPFLTDEEICVIRAWIEAGAEND